MLKRRADDTPDHGGGDDDRWCRFDQIYKKVFGHVLLLLRN
jgi:hypothetical protein